MKNRQILGVKLWLFLSILGLVITLVFVAALILAWPRADEVSRRASAEFDAGTILESAAPLAAQIGNLKSSLAVDTWIEDREREVENALAARGASLKARQRKTVEWAGTKLTTPISIVYVHGFSASRLELDPVVSEVARSLGANVFFARLAAHGISDGEDFATVHARMWAIDVEEALAIGHKIGERVVVIAMSTGVPLVLENVLRERSQRASANLPAALVLLSPNYEVRAFGAKLLEGAFGKQIARLVSGGYYEFKTENAMHAERWTARYRAEGILAMLNVVAMARTLDFSKIEIPALTIYSRNDNVVDTTVIESRAKEIKSPHSAIVVLPDAGRHELFSATFDAAKVPVLRELILAWLQEAL